MRVVEPGDASMSPLFGSLPLALVLMTAGPPSARVTSDPDSLYYAVHPRLAFTTRDLPSLRRKLHDGGADDEAYATIRGYVTDAYPTAALGELLGIAYGLDFSLNLGLVAHLDEPSNDAAWELGRRFTLALADSLAADANTFYAPIRLRALCFGYDACMQRATTEERALVRAEIESYVDSLMLAFNFERWLHPPYTSNITAMIGASLGIAAVCLADEMEPARVSAALARADSFVTTWMRYHVDPDGTCFEGVQYGSWAMRHLPWYFEARRRYDGVDYATREDVRRIERWLAYEVLPERGGVVNNLNDTAYLNHPLARHNTYLEWATWRWNSGVAAWLWDRLLGPEDGYDWGNLADHPATALWHRDAGPVNPGALLPRSFLWKRRGLYYYRTGWPSRGDSDDVVFSFYSGIFHGGHSQSDQNNFTLYAFGTRFAADNGFDRPNWASEAHNMVFVDGKGQHYSGTSVGTDGRIDAHVLTPYADYLLGDATAAYGTHSAYNEPGVPFPDDDWSYGYLGANPVEHARREWLVVHGPAIPPYFVLVDDLKKDATPRDYQWRMHTEGTNAVDLGSDPIHIGGTRGVLEIDVISPASNELARGLEPYENPSVDPNTNVLTLTARGERGFFALVLRPTANARPSPIARVTSHAWGGLDVLAWPDRTVDVIIAHEGTDTIDVTASVPGGRDLPVRTDARVAHVRQRPGETTRAVFVRVTMSEVEGLPLVQIRNGAATVVLDETTAHVDSPGVEFTLFGPEIRSVRAGDREIPFVRRGAFVMSERAVGPGRAPRMPSLRVYPRPMARSSTIVVENPVAGRVTIDLFDVAGRRVRSLFDGVLAPGVTHLAFDGLDDVAQPLASGVYFARASGEGMTATARIVLVR
jgi:hypothetical protein